MKKNTLLFTVWLCSLLCGWTQLSAQEVLPFPEPASASVTGKTLKDSKHQWRKTESHLPKDAPNIVQMVVFKWFLQMGSVQANIPET